MTKNSIQFRLARAEDLPELNRISLASKKYWGYPEQWLMHWKEDLTVTERHLKEQFLMLVANEDQILGFIAISENKDHYEITHLWVKPEHIGRGYGRSLVVKALKEYCRNRHPVFVTADPNAEAFYKKLGFETVGQEESYPPGRTLPVMKKSLP